MSACAKNLMSRQPEPEQDPPGDPEAVARTICLRLLTARARSRAELAQALRRRGVPDEAASTVLVRFAELGLVDDAALAEAVVRVQHGERGLAAPAIAAKLRQRGVQDDAVRTAVGAIDCDSERRAATALVQRRMRSLRSLEPTVRRRRLVGLLARRGYSAGLAAQVLRDALGELADAEDGGAED